MASKKVYLFWALVAAGVSTFADYWAVNRGWTFTAVLVTIFLSSLAIDYVLASWGRGR